MVFVNNMKFSLFSFLGEKKKPPNSICWCFRSKKAFLTIDLSILKSGHFWIFVKGLTHDFCQKCEIFSLFLFRQNKPWKRFWWCSNLRQRFFRRWRYGFWKVAILGISIRGKPIFFVKHSKFFLCPFYRQK